MPKRLPVHGLDPAGAPDGYAPIVSGGKFILDDPAGGIGLPWFIASEYGADEGGTDSANTTALNALIADLNAAGEGVFYCDGRFTVDGALDTITAHANIFGDGGGDLQGQNAASSIKITATTGYLMTLAGDGTVVENIGFENPTTTTQTAGAAIRVTQGDLNRYRNVTVRGFYDNITIEDGAIWTMADCYFVGPVRYGLYVRHIDLPDGGDMAITGCAFYSATRDASAAVRWESGGGMKFSGNKINTLSSGDNFAVGFDALFTGITTVDLNMFGNSIENVTGPCIRGNIGAFGEFSAVTIVGNQFGYYSTTSVAAVDITSWIDVTVVGNTALARFSGSSAAAVKLTSVTTGSVGLNTVEGFAGGELSQTSCTGITTGGGVPTSRLISAGTGLSGGGDLSADRTLSIDTSAEAERIRDVVGATLVQGAGVTIVVDDAGDTITISATSAGGALRPLTTESGGVPDFVWDDNNELVMTEAP